jgi:hypothetical protein
MSTTIVEPGQRALLADLVGVLAASAGALEAAGDVSRRSARIPQGARGGR